MKNQFIVGVFACASFAAVAAAQTAGSAKQSGKPSAPTTTVGVDRLVSQTFENGLTTAQVNGAHSLLQTVFVAWKAYPQARYRVQRSAQSNGPWVTIHDVASVNDSIHGLPPSQMFYVRVLALRDGGKSGVSVVDSSKSVMVQTGAEAAIAGHPQEVGGLTCSASGNTINLSWSPLAGFPRYVVTPFIIPPSAGNAPNLAVPSSDPAMIVTNTKATYTMSTAGRMVLRVQARVDINDWPSPGQTYTFLTPMPTQNNSTGYVGIHLDASGAHCG